MCSNVIDSISQDKKQLRRRRSFEITFLPFKTCIPVGLGLFDVFLAPSF